MSATWSWKSNGDSAVVRKTDDGLVPGAAITAINNNTNPLQYITGTGGVTIDNSTPGTTQISGGGAVQTVTNNATVLSASIASNRLTLGYSGTALPFANGGTNVTAVPTSVSGSNYSAWDSAGNAFADAYISGETSISSNTTFTISSLTGLIYCNNNATAAYSVVLPDVQSGNAVSQGYQMDVINVGSFPVYVSTQNAPINFTANGTGFSMTVTVISVGQLAIGDVVSGLPGGSATITSIGSTNGYTGVYTLGTSQSTYGSTVLLCTHASAPYPLFAANPNTMVRCTFVGNNAVPYWNYVVIPNYNGVPNIYQYLTGNSGIDRALYLNPNNGTSIYAQTTSALNVVVVFGNANSGITGNIFLPDPATIALGTQYTISTIDSTWRIYNYTSRTWWETNFFGTTNLFYTVDPKTNPQLMPYTTSNSHKYILIRCISNSSTPGFNSWQFTEQPLIKSDAQTATDLVLQIITTVAELYCSYAQGPLIAQISQPVRAVEARLPTYAECAANVTRINLPTSCRTAILADIYAGLGRTDKIQYLKQFSDCIIKNFGSQKISIFAANGQLVSNLFAYSQIHLTYTNPPAYTTGYISGTTMTITQTNVGGIILGSAAFPSNVYAFGTSAVYTCTGGITGIGDVGTYTVTNPGAVNIGSAGTPVQIWIDPDPRQQFNIQTTSTLDNVSANLKANNYDPGLNTINSNTTPTTILDNTAAAGISISGTANAILILPPVATLNIGWFTVVRSSTAGTTTVQANNGSGSSIGVVVIIPPNSKSTVYLVSQTNTVADWSLNTIVAGDTVVATTYAAKFTNNSTTPIALNSTSSQFQRFSSGIANQVVTMPDVTTIAIGTIYQLYNQTLFFAMTVKSFDGSTILGSIPCGSSFQVFSISATDNSPTGWEMLFAGQTVGSAAATRAVNYVYGGTNTDIAPTTALQYLRTTSTIRQGYNTATWGYAYQPVDSAYWNPTFKENGVTRTISQLCFYYTNTFFSGTAGATTKMVHCQLGVNVTAYGGASGTGPYTITLPFTSSQTIDFPIGVVNGGNACCFAQIVSGNNYLTVLNTPGYTTTGGDTWSASFFYFV